MKRSHIVMLAMFLVAIPLTLYFGSQMTGRAYYFTSTLVIIEILLPFLLAFEDRKPQARELVVIAVLSALAVAARVVIHLHDPDGHGCDSGSHKDDLQSQNPMGAAGRYWCCHGYGIRGSLPAAYGIGNLGGVSVQP